MDLNVIWYNIHLRYVAANGRRSLSWVMCWLNDNTKFEYSLINILFTSFSLVTLGQSVAPCLIRGLYILSAMYVRYLQGQPAIWPHVLQHHSHTCKLHAGDKWPASPLVDWLEFWCTCNIDVWCELGAMSILSSYYIHSQYFFQSLAQKLWISSVF